MRVGSILNKKVSQALHISKRLKTHSNVNFQQLVEDKRLNSKCSIIIENCKNENNSSNIFEYCENFGPINKIFAFNPKSNNRFYLLQYKNPKGAENFLKNTNYHKCIEGSLNLPILSRFVSIKPQKASSNRHYEIEKQTPFSIKNLHEELKLVNGISEQMNFIYNYEKQYECDSALRFFICNQIEEMLLDKIPSCAVLPFGSTVNGIGKRTSDLDMAISLDYNCQNNQNDRSHFTQIKLENENEKRRQIQKFIRFLCSMIRMYLPHSGRCDSILPARVPIVKFRDTLLDLDCDLSISNLSGFYMSELLYNICELDSRIRPFIYTLRHWAKAQELVLEPANHYFTNFMITLLGIHFLQVVKPLPLIPPFNQMLNVHTIQNYNIDDIPKLNIIKNEVKFESNESDSPEDLLKMFFNYYSSFDFKTTGISLKRATQITKFIDHPLVMENPLDPTLNVCKNVGRYELEKFISICRLHSNMDNNGNLLKYLTNHYQQLNPNESKGIKVTNFIKV